MKKIFITTLIGGSMLLTACQYGGNEAQNIDEQSNGTEMLNVANNNEYNNDFNKNNQTNKFGYVRKQKSPIEGQGNYYIAGLDKEQMANSISNLVTQLPNVVDVGTLVTTEEVLIAYETTSNNRFETADQVKKTAASMVPRYFHVYVSDNPAMIKDIERYGQWDTTKTNNDQLLHSTIKNMLKSPQGRPLNDGENENGEGINEMNGDADRDDIHEMTDENNGNRQMNNQVDENKNNPNNQTNQAGSRGIY